MNDPIKNIRREVTLEERYTNVSEQLANISERYDALSSALEKERLLRSEMVNEQAASELAALRKLHEEEVARIKAEARAEILRELSQREAEVEKRSAALDQREKELDDRREKAIKEVEAKVQSLNAGMHEKILKETSTAMGSFSASLETMLSAFSASVKAMLDHDHDKMESEMLSYRQGATEVRDQLVEQLQKKLDKIGSENCSKRKQLNYWIRRILGVNSEKAKFTPEERATLYDSLCANDLLTPDQQKQLKLLLARDQAYRARQAAEKQQQKESGHGRNPLPDDDSMPSLPAIDVWPEECRGHEDEYYILSRIPSTKVFPARSKLFKQTINRIVAVKKDDSTRTPISDNADDAVLAKSYFSNELASKMEVDKYVNHMPFYRQLEQMNRDGWDVAKATVNDVHKKVCLALEDLYRLQVDVVMSSEHLAADGCPMPVVDNDKHKTTGKYIVEYRSLDLGIPIFIYEIGTRGNGRGAGVIKSHLLPWTGSLILCDGCQSYDWIAKAGRVVCRCSAHARREFERAKTENVFLSNFGLASFQIIYGVEELIIELGLTGADKIAYRKENAAIAWQSLLAWCVFTVNDVPQNSQMHKACNYVIRHYDELTAYMDYDVVPLDNNATESAIRALVMGKQNYLFCQNEESCHYAAVMYTFFAACKVLKINPEKWLSDVLDKIPFTPKEKLSELLPQNWIKSNPLAIV